MTIWQLALRSLRHYWRLHLAVLAGVAIATAVLTGALIVGDSVRGSLRHLALDGLRDVDFVLARDRFFRSELADTLRQQEAFQREFQAAVPTGVLPGITVEQIPRRASGVTLIAAGRDSGNRDAAGLGPRHLPRPDEIVISRSLAEELLVEVGDRVVVQLPGSTQTQDDRPSSQTHDPGLDVAGLQVLEIIPTDELGAFRPEPGQPSPHCILVDLTVLHGTRGEPGPANTRTLPEVTVVTVVGRANGVTLIAGGVEFWNLGTGGPRPMKLPGPDEIVINRALADDLKVNVGHHLVVRLPKSSEVPADSPLGHKSDLVRSIAGLKLIEIIPAEGLGRFRLNTSQQSPRNAFVSLQVLQAGLDEPGRVNTLLLSAGAAGKARDVDSVYQLQQMLRPSLDDYGIRTQRIERRFRDPLTDSETTIDDFYQFTTDRLIWDQATAQVAQRALADFHPELVFTYLATSISRKSDAGEEIETIPYSMISAVSDDLMARLLTESDVPSGELPADDEMVLSSWSAEDMGAQVGDVIEVVYFDPETTHGQAKEARATFRLKAIVPLTEPAQPYRRNRAAVFEAAPKLANDPELTPTVEGITDEESINNWDPPFPYDARRIRSQDEQYWDHYRTTPKAFISLTAGQRLWQSRFGEITAIRVQASHVGSESQLTSRLLDALQNDPTTAFMITPVKRNAMQAANGTTPFEYLFLGFSMFLISSSLMLVALLFRLGLELRASELGLLRAVGWSNRMTRRATLFEAMCVAVAGAILGVLLGVGYAWLMLVGLRTWWLDAVVTPFLQLHASPTSPSLWLGLLIGVVFSLAVIVAGTRRLGHVSPRTLLGGTTGEVTTGAKTVSRRGVIVLGGMVGLAGVLGILATALHGEAQAGAFFGCGACILVAGVLYVVRRLRFLGTQRRSVTKMALAGLAERAAARHPTRSALTVGLMAAASFLIVAISAFRLSPTEEGTGGFNLIGQTDRPLFVDFGDPTSRDQWLGQAAGALRGTTILPLRVQAGEDASCRNLYRPSRPRILGVSRLMADHFDDAQQGFRWSATADLDGTANNPWRLLEAGLAGGSDAIPVVLDKNTAMYSLRLYRGIGEEFELDYGLPAKLRFRVVGLLSNSILQGNLIVGERQLVKHFPDNAGYQYFLVRSSVANQQTVAGVLEDRFGDEGMDVTSSVGVLRDLLAVQNTYLSTFQSLGALGLLLGTFGLAAVQIRSVVERRGELALLRSVGFSRQRIGRMVMLENLVLLVTGLGVGVLAALIAVIPHMIVGGATIPWRSLVWMLLTILVVGLFASFLSVRPATRAPIVDALRGD